MITENTMTPGQMKFLGLEINPDCKWFIRPKYEYRNSYKSRVKSWRIVAKNLVTCKESPEIGDFLSEAAARDNIARAWHNGTIFPVRMLGNSR
jgi:hypothetical protein